MLLFIAQRCQHTLSASIFTCQIGHSLWECTECNGGGGYSCIYYSVCVDYSGERRAVR